MSWKNPYHCTINLSLWLSTSSRISLCAQCSLSRVHQRSPTLRVRSAGSHRQHVMPRFSRVFGFPCGCYSRDSGEFLLLSSAQAVLLTVAGVSRGFARNSKGSRALRDRYVRQLRYTDKQTNLLAHRTLCSTRRRNLGHPPSIPYTVSHLTSHHEEDLLRDRVPCRCSKPHHRLYLPPSLHDPSLIAFPPEHNIGNPPEMVSHRTVNEERSS